jgi:hypothetical protein
MINITADDIRTSIAFEMAVLRAEFVLTEVLLEGVEASKRGTLVSTYVKFAEALPDVVAAQSPFADREALSAAVYVETKKAIALIQASREVVATKGSA